MPRNIVRIIVIISCGIVLIGATRKVVASKRNAEAAAQAEQQQRWKAEVIARRQAELRQLETLPQPFSKLLTSMNRGEPQLGTDRVLHRVQFPVGVPIVDGMYLYDLVRQTKPQRTAEVGFAEGFSTLYILAALQSNGGMHVAMDPFETRDYYGVGLQKIKEAAMDKHFRFLDERSVAGLPELTAEHKSYGVVFIDGDHRFDAAFTDFILSDSLCPKGGYILFHDIWMPSTQKIIAFIEHNRPDYARRPVPEHVNIAAFQKVADDQRPWKHFVDF